MLCNYRDQHGVHKVNAAWSSGRQPGVGFGRGPLSVSSQSLCLCKNRSEPFTPRLVHAGRIKIHTHSLGTGFGPGPAQSRDKGIEAQRRGLTAKHPHLATRFATCLFSVWRLWKENPGAAKHLVFTKWMARSDYYWWYEFISAGPYFEKK